MRSNSIIAAPHWLTPAELKLYNKFKRAFCADMKAREIPMNPFLAMRIYDVCVAMLYLRRAECALCVPEGGVPGAVDLAVFDTLGKHQDRLRKLLKDLEQHLERAEKTLKKEAEHPACEAALSPPDAQTETPKVESAPATSNQPKPKSGANFDYAKAIKDGRYVLSKEKHRAEEELRQLTGLKHLPG